MDVKDFKKDSKGLIEVVNIVLAIVLVIIVGLIGTFIADTTVTAVDLTTANVSATGSLTWSGNSTCGDLVNITNAAGTKITFYINVTGAGCVVAPSAAGYTNVSFALNTSVHTATNISAAINANSTINATMNATNSTTNVTLLTYTTAGSAGNAVLTTETSANASWTSGTLTGGADKSDFADMQANILGAGETGSDFIVILIIAFIGAIAIGYLMLMRKQG